MFIEILKRTPFWVFVLFFVLLAAGYSQSKDRVIRRSQVSILPMAMVFLSLYGVLSAFGTAPLGLISWIAGVVLTVWVGMALAIPRGVTFSAETETYSVPGSWLPLALMMAIFFIKYAVGVILARHLPIAIEPSFIASIGLCYGLFSGIFLAWALVIRRAARKASRWYNLEAEKVDRRSI